MHEFESKSRKENAGALPKRSRRAGPASPQTSQLTAMEDLANQSPEVRETAQLQEQLNAPNTTGMSDELKTGLESLSGLDLSSVRVHYGSPKPAQIQAHAYTQGQDIYVAPGQERHVPHEGWHVVQQMQGRVQPTMQFEGTDINDSPALEREADVMGARAATARLSAASGTARKPIHGEGPVQRKLGVEYETKWTIDDPENVTANHKEPVLNGPGFHIESDNNDLEFVSYPPSETALELYQTVGRMQNKAEDMIGRLNSPLPMPPGPFLKPDYQAILGSLPEGPFSLIEALQKIVREEDQGLVTEVHALSLAETLKQEGWYISLENKGTETAENLKDHSWSGEDLASLADLSQGLPFGPAPPVRYDRSLRTLLGSEPLGDFRDKTVIVEPAEESMRARPQFTFGIDLAKLPELFQMFITGPQGALNQPNQQQLALSYRSGEKQTLENYGKSQIGEKLKPAHEKATGIFASHDPAGLNDKAKGLIHYLVYYLHQMRSKEWTSQKEKDEETKIITYFEPAEVRAVHIGQVLLASLEDEAGGVFPLNVANLESELSHVVLTSEDETAVKAMAGKTIQEIRRTSSVTGPQRDLIEQYVKKSLDKMKDDPVYPKHFFVLMSRSGFDRMYDSLEPTQKPLVNDYVETRVLPQFLEEREDVSLFKVPYYFKRKSGEGTYERGLSYGPTVKEWWNSIKSPDHRQTITGEGLTEEQSKRDKMSPPKEFIDYTGKPDETQSLGALNMMDQGLSVIELREWGQVIPASEWQKHTLDMLKAFVHKIQGEVFEP